MGFNHAKVVFILWFAICLIQITALKAKSKKHILKNKTKRSNNEHIPTIVEQVNDPSNLDKRMLDESASNALSYHRSLVPDMSFSSQIEEMPVEEHITMGSNEADVQPTKKDTVSRVLEQFIGSDLDNLNQPTLSDYSGWSSNNSEQPAAAVLPPQNSYHSNNTTPTPTNTTHDANRYQPKNTSSSSAPSSNSLHISQFSCVRIQRIMCMYEQVSLLCPMKCQSFNNDEKNDLINGPHNNTINSSVDSSQGSNNIVQTTTTTTTSKPYPSQNNTTPSYNLNENNHSQSSEQLLGVYMKYDEKVYIDKTITDITNNATQAYANSDAVVSPTNITNNATQAYANSGAVVSTANITNNTTQAYTNSDAVVSTANITNNATQVYANSDAVVGPKIITTQSQLEAIQNEMKFTPNYTTTTSSPYDESVQQPTAYQANGRTLTSVDPTTSSYIVSPTNDYDQIHDLLNDSFYILAGVVDRTTKGFYLKNMGKINSTSAGNATTPHPIVPDKNNTNNKDPEECSNYIVDQCLKSSNVSQMCPYLCRECTPWIGKTNCSASCGVGLQERTRTCTFPNGTKVVENATYICNSIPCNATCKVLTNWGPCLKPIDGVSVRAKNCTLADGSSQIYFEHRACNDVVDSRSLEKRQPPSNLAAYLSFDKFRDDINVVYDEQSDNSNDLNVLNIKLFDGNFTCGFGALLTQHDSIMIFNDNVFRNFKNKTFSILAWVFPKSGAHKGNRPQTILQLISNENNFGVHMVELANDTTLEWTHYNSNGQRIFSRKSNLKIQMDRWVHIALVYNSRPSIATIYINSVPSTIDNDSIYSPLINTRLTKKNVGVFQAIGNNINLNKPFYGVLDEIFIFNKKINPNLITEIADTCRFRVGRGCPSPLLGFCPDCPSCTTPEVLSQDKNFDNDRNTPYVPINPPTIS